MIGEGQGQRRLSEQDHDVFRVDTSLDGYSALYRMVLRKYGYRCSLSGAEFDIPPSTLHPDLEVVAIQPREHGGELSVRNYVPVLNSLAAPFRDGLITVGEDYRIIVPHPDLLDFEMVSALRSTFLLPSDAIFKPSQKSLAYHRRFALGR